MLRAKRPRKPLSELEHLVMDVLWKRSQSTAEVVREALAARHPMKDSTARTILKRLEEKGYVTHILDNRTFLYSPAEPAPMVAGRAVKRILEWFCEGSVEQLLVGMVDSSLLDRKELQRLAERIAAAKNPEKVAGRSAKANGEGGK